MWLFSSSSADHDDDDDNTSTEARSSSPTSSTIIDEESMTIERPQKSYSAMHCNEDIGNGAASSSSPIRGDNEATPEYGANNPIIVPINHHNGTNNTNNTTNSNGKQRGIIYFRPITPSDRSIIQTLHEQWFPVDYKSDFFDALCATTSTSSILRGANNQPLYCCVACFKELSDEEFEERLRRRREREEEMENSTSGWSFWSSANNKSTSNDGAYDEEDNDCILWEIDDNWTIDDDGDRIVNVHESSSSYQEGITGASSAVAYGEKSQSPQSERINTPINNDTKKDDDAIESGDSVFSIHRRTEMERMRKFYTNGFRFADENNDTASSSCHNSNCNPGVSNGNPVNKNQKGNANNNCNNKNNANIEGPYYNDNGERIVGCIVGSFLPSTLPSSKHRSTLDEKLGRDETAQLLIPNPTLHTKMFYIMTLGTTREFRRCGLGSVLVNKVVELIEQRKEAEELCGVLYLHVITYNGGAIRLYERLGFTRVKEIQDYYTINSVNYDCYLYARYFHGNRGHQTTFDVLYGLATSIIRKLGYAFIPTS